MKFSFVKTFPAKPELRIDEMIELGEFFAVNQITEFFNIPSWAAAFVARASEIRYEKRDGKETVTVTVDTERGCGK